MQDSSPLPRAQNFETVTSSIGTGRRLLGQGLIAAASVILLAMILIEGLHRVGLSDFGFENWRPVLYAFILWGVALGIGQVEGMLFDLAGPIDYFVEAAGVRSPTFSV